MSDFPGRPEPPTDDAIRAMLEARAARSGPVSLDVERVVAEARRRVDPGSRAPRLIPRVAVAAATLAAAVVLAAVVAIPIVNRPAASGPASAGPTREPEQSPSPPTVAEPRILSPAELGELVRTRAAELNGTIVATRGRLERDPSMPCIAGEICANTLLADSGAGFHLRPIGDIGPGPWDGSGAKDGTFAVRITAALEGGRPVVEYIGDLTMPKDGALAWSVTDILGGAARTEGRYAAVDGWLVRDPLHPCGSNPRPPPGPAYGCPSDDWLTESAYQPLRPDGSSLGPRDAIDLPSGSYDEWAPNPASFGRDSVGVEPRRATYLMWLVMDGCGPNADCYLGLGSLHRRIVGRFDPIAGVAVVPAPTPSPSGSAPPTQPPTRDAWTVAEAATQTPRETTDFIVHGYLEAVLVPGVRCAAPPPKPQDWPAYSCGERDWLTDAPFHPVPTWNEPVDGLLVQTGAYDAFAANPSWTDLYAAPRLGTYVLRQVVRPACEFPVPAPDCADRLLRAWEVIQSPMTAPIHFPRPVVPIVSSPGPGTDGSGDTPCRPTGQPCG